MDDDLVVPTVPEESRAPFRNGENEEGFAVTRDKENCFG